MLLEDGDDLLAGGDALAVENASARLVADTVGKGQEVLQVMAQAFLPGDVEKSLGNSVAVEPIVSLPSHRDDVLGDSQEIPIGHLPDLLVAGGRDFTAAALGSLLPVGENEDSGRQEVPDSPHQSGQHADTVPQLLGVRRRMDVGLHDRAVHADLRTFLDTLVTGRLDQQTVDLFESLRA